MSRLYGEELSAGARVGPCVVERVVARGEMSLVYQARREGGGERLALKVLRTEYGFSASALRRFQQEVALLRRVRHPHVVALREAGELEDGRPWLAMEWVEGPTLARWLASRGRLEVGEALPLVAQLCGALEASHQAGLVHRDLKAQNVLVREGPGGAELVLVDFGIARPLEPGPDSPHTSTGRVLGTPVALAPEQIRGGAVGARTDVYGLGVLLYQLLSGQLPFRGSSATELMEQHLSAPVPALAQWAPVSPAVEAVVRRCLAKRPEDRWEGAGRVLEALRAAAEAPWSAGPPARSAALYVELALEAGARASALERLDGLWEQARGALEAGGLSVQAEGADMLLAVAPLPEEAGAERRERARLLGLARELWRGLEEARRGEALRVGVTLHAAPGEGRELLHPARWAHPGHGVMATPAALEGLEPGVSA
jgi:serine/threonine-protein kinase